MASRDMHEALRGVVAERVLDHIFEEISSKQWAELLKGPLGRAAGDVWDEGLARKLVEAGADTGCALHRAVEGGHRHAVNHPTGEWSTYQQEVVVWLCPSPHFAADVGDAGTVGFLLREGADKGALSIGGSTALYRAAAPGHLAATQVILATGVGTEIRCGEIETVALNVAARSGHVGVLRALIAHRADVDVCD